MLLHFRCPECEIWSSDTFDERLVAEYDRTLAEARQAIEAGYERLVRHNMTELTEGFCAALERDLIGPDDFRMTQPAGCSGCGRRHSR